MSNSNIECNVNIQEKCINTIKTLCEKYENNPYILQRINNHINIFLSQTLEHEMKNYEKRLDRANMLTNEQNMFIQVFLSKNKYYYLNTNSCFYEYNGKNYQAVKEDDILHKLLSDISTDRVLMDWKYKTKINIIKQIKERNLLKSIPETYTIQNVLNLFHPNIFSSKSHVKYFLTIIGDNILKKNQDLIFLINANTKRMITEIDNIAYITIGNSNTIHNFAMKYHESHNYNQCRLININDNYSIDILKDSLKTYGLDVLCVASHYSNRYGSSEYFINTKAYEDLKKYTLYLKNNNQSSIIENFCNNYIEKVNPDLILNSNNNIKNNYIVQWKNIHYFWKQFISGLNLPNIIYSNNLKNILKEKYEYKEETDSFYNITSKYLPFVSNFIQFWDSTIKNITIHNNGTTENYIDNELEIDELCSAFKDWCSNNNLQNVNTNLNLNTNTLVLCETEVIKILKHFYSNIEIVENKYILNIQCSLINKSEDIQNALDLLNIEYKLKHNDENSMISFDDAYTYYCSYCSNNLNTSINGISTKYIASKHFFEKYLYANLYEYIIFDKFISNKWYNQNNIN